LLQLLFVAAAHSIGRGVQFSKVALRK